ncbi:glutathione S-transferase-like [Oppia nitens]|uniref:glutathione S-transferase-like n=1 Tax=Oppia nitens TaxID=1686743 RepID=UPI0023DA1DBB|nr:glutathione S-transferase-like [Oppia nitens]
MTPTLGYWNIRGLGQPIRLLLAYTDTKYVDKRYNCGPAPDFDASEWLNDKYKLGLNFPNLPYYIDGDIKITQSLAINRYIARKTKLEGQTDEERLRVSLAEQQLVDMNEDFSHIAYDPNFETLKVDYLKNLPNTLKLFNDFLDNRPFLAGESVTYVDFIGYELLDKLNAFAPEMVSKVNNLKKYIERVESLPQIANYLKSSPKQAYNGPMAKWGGSVE